MTGPGELKVKMLFYVFHDKILTGGSFFFGCLLRTYVDDSTMVSLRFHDFLEAIVVIILLILVESFATRISSCIYASSMRLVKDSCLLSVMPSTAGVIHLLGVLSGGERLCSKITASAIFWSSDLS